MKLFSKFTVSDGRRTGVKTEFNVNENDHSRSFKVTCLGIIGKSTRQHIPLYNDVGLISTGCEDMATESTENGRFPLPHSRLMPLSREPLRISASAVYCEKLGHWTTFLLLIIWDYLHSNFHGGFRKCILKRSA